MHRTENLLLGDVHVVAHVGEHRRRHEIALRQRPLGQTFAAGQRARAFLLADAEIARTRARAAARDTSGPIWVSGSSPLPTRQLLAERRHPVGEFVIDFVARRTDACPRCRSGRNWRTPPSRRRARRASISASAKTMSGDLPPSSSETRLRLPADARTIDLAGHVRAGEGDLVDARMRRRARRRRFRRSRARC